ncbi:histidine kinase [Streptomyces sp. B6B3]|uniref:sensor histidine kinase n=1 Tax=Streptomyces sp. B6B3 TaxID=3153570 RepID=UPI00325C786A
MSTTTATPPRRRGPGGAPGRVWHEYAASPTRPVRALMGRVRAFDARHPVCWDLVPVLLLALVAVADLDDDGWRERAKLPDLPTAVPWVQAVSFLLPLVWRRRYPLATLAAMAVPGAIALWTGLTSGTPVCAYIALYSVALRSSVPRLAGALGMLALGTVAWAWRWPTTDVAETYFRSVMLTLVCVLAGFVVRIRRDHIEALIDRAARLEVERDQRERLAAAAERARIAREMHDIIGHNLAVITGLADGGAYAARRSPDRAAQALDAIGATSRQALGELRRLLEVLRHEPAAGGGAELAPQPDLAELERLLDRVREAGLGVLSSVDGRPARPSAALASELSEGEQLTVYRVVQEALTNTLKYGGPDTRARLAVDRAPDGVTVTVTDDGRGASGPAPAGGDGTGQGIGGMRERAAVYDGTLEAGPLPSGGWRVRLWLPTGRGAAVPGPTPRVEPETPGGRPR